MGIPAPLIEFFLQEHRYLPWKGRLLTLGRQTVLADPARLKRLLEGYDIVSNIRVVQPGAVQIDRQTVQAMQEPEKAYVNDVTLFSSFCPATLDVLDVTDYEGANIIHNMCLPIPRKLVGKFDVIFNGSVLDNIFDPAQAMRNITRLLARAAGSYISRWRATLHLST